MKAFAAAVAISVTAAFPAQVLAQTLLTVPYISQSEALCGGAAAAMVMRFWGARGVYADDFASLVDKAANGIHTSALGAALEARGWRIDAGGGDLQRLSQEVGRGHPVIALIEDRPGRFHYVVVVAAPGEGAIVLHDPARAPDRAIDRAAFDSKWLRSDRWMLVALPGPAPAANTAEDVSAIAEKGSSPCQSRVDEGVALAQRGDTAAARSMLEAASAACPREASAWRELAGLDALEKNWAAAAAHAREALSRDSADAHSRRILATAEYLLQDDLAALEAWNRLEEPHVDLVDVKGLVHTRYRVVSDAIGVEPRALLTPEAIRVAERRVRDVPAISTARVTFRPLERGQAQVEATIVERERAPVSYPSWLILGVGAAATREISASFANVSGGGDVADLAWRWWAHRPRVAATYAAPGPGGIWRLEASRETQTFGSFQEETRTRLGAELSNWLDQRIRVTGGIALDRWREHGRTGAVATRVQLWPVLDRAAVELGAGGWSGSGARFGTVDARLRLRSKASSSGTVFLAQGGYQLASSSAPASLWPGADSGHARDVLLRAHPLLDDGVIAGGVFGRRIAFASGELQRWLPSAVRGMLRVAPAAFLDVARATRGLPASDRRLQYDLGGGLRIALPGSGVLRVDVARGLRDGRSALSVGWQR